MARNRTGVSRIDWAPPWPPPILLGRLFFSFFSLSPPLRAGHTRGRAPGRAGAAFGLGPLWRPGAGWRKQKGRARKREARMKGRRRGGEGRGLWGGLPTAAAHSHFRHPPGALPSPRRPPPRHPSLPAMKITLAALALAAAVAGAQVWAQGLGLGRRPKGEVGRNCPRAAQPAHPPFRRCGPPTLATALGAAPLPPAGPGTGLGVNPARRKWGAGLARGAGRAPRRTVPRPRFKTRGAVPLSPPSPPPRPLTPLPTPSLSAPSHPLRPTGRGLRDQGAFGQKEWRRRGFGARFSVERRVLFLPPACDEGSARGNPPLFLSLSCRPAPSLTHAPRTHRHSHPSPHTARPHAEDGGGGHPGEGLPGPAPGK